MIDPREPRHSEPDDTEASLLIEQTVLLEFDDEPDGLIEEGDIPPF